ncbi:hypothetical protein VIGAN_08309600, partial [Vigna angularis var. angularis]
SLRGLLHLQYLDLSYNKLEGTLDISENDRFQWPTNLQELILRGNSFSNKFFLSLRGLPHLQCLDLSENQLEGTLDISGLLTLSNLRLLFLSNNNIHNFVAYQGIKKNGLIYCLGRKTRYSI